MMKIQDGADRSVTLEMREEQHYDAFPRTSPLEEDHGNTVDNASSVFTMVHWP